MVITRPNITVRTKQKIIHKYENDPLVGFYNINNKPEGFLYDSKRWSSFYDLKLPTLPKFSDVNLQGLAANTYFLSGVGNKDLGDLKVLSIEEEKFDNERSWLPFIKSGFYYIYDQSYYYYSDNSRVQYVDPTENINNRNIVRLEEEPSNSSPIFAASYRRNLSNNSISYYRKINFCTSFSGTYTNEQENETVSNLGKINWDNVNFNKNEFILSVANENTFTLLFNKDYTKRIGVEPVTFQDLAACEVIGYSNGSSYQSFYLKHFPVIPSSFKLYVVNNDSWEEWERVETWFSLLYGGSSYGEKRYFLDKDLGIVYFASAAERSAPLLGSYIVCSYTVTLRIEYEEQNLHKNITAINADVSPLTQSINQGFICITNTALEAASITLEIDKNLIPSTSPKIYGPIYIGNDFALLKATVTSVDGLPVPGIEVIFTLSPTNIGYINGASSGIGITNEKGEAYASYQPPVSAEDIGYYVTNRSGFDPQIRTSTHPNYLGGSYKDVIVKTESIDFVNSGIDNLYIYQILKDEPLLAYDNIDDYIDNNFTPPYWVTQLPLDPAKREKWRREIAAEYDLKDWTEVNTVDGIQSDGTIAGRKVVLYRTDINLNTPNIDSNAINPITGELGAIIPVRPELIETIDDITDPYNGYTRLVYLATAVPDPDPIDSLNTIGGYWIVSRNKVMFQAYCWGKRYNRYIYSNKINTRIQLPSYLLGEYINQELQKIPYGWKLISSNDNIAAGLNGATFITVNPTNGPYKILDLITGTIDDTWASAPFKSVAFQVNVIE